LKTKLGIVCCEKKICFPRSEDYKTRIPTQATVRDVAAIFAKRSACEICIIDIVHFRSFEVVLIASDKNWLYR